MQNVRLMRVTGSGLIDIGQFSPEYAHARRDRVRQLLHYLSGFVLIFLSHQIKITRVSGAESSRECPGSAGQTGVSFRVISSVRVARKWQRNR